MYSWGRQVPHRRTRKRTLMVPGISEEKSRGIGIGWSWPSILGATGLVDQDDGPLHVEAEEMEAIHLGLVEALGIEPERPHHPFQNLPLAGPRATERHPADHLRHRADPARLLRGPVGLLVEG